MNVPDPQRQRRNQEARDILRLLELGYVPRQWTRTRPNFPSELRQATNEHLDDVEALRHQLAAHVSGVRQLDDDPRLLPTAIRGLAYLLHYQADDLFQHAHKLEWHATVR